MVRMRHAALARSTSFAVFLGLLALSILAGPERAAAAGRKALLIGINEYMAVPDLRGALNDIELIRDVLVTRFGFAAEDIEVLTNEQATRDNMLAAFERLAERTQPGDFVYCTIRAAHRARRDGDEQGDERDETLIPHDARTGQVRDITDDELARALAKLDDASVVIVLDSCHSGTATRGAFVQPRAVPPDTRRAVTAVATRAVVPLVRRTTLTGAASTRARRTVDGRPHGLFTTLTERSRMRRRRSRRVRCRA
jgi:hypothetical protein